MTKTAEKIRDRIAEMVTLFGFEYDGKDGNVDPCYDFQKQRPNILLYFDGTEQTVHDINAVMSTPFIGGKTLTEVADKIEITEW